MDVEAVLPLLETRDLAHHLGGACQPQVTSRKSQAISHKSRDTSEACGKSPDFCGSFSCEPLPPEFPLSLCRFPTPSASLPCLLRCLFFLPASVPLTENEGGGGLDVPSPSWVKLMVPDTPSVPASTATALSTMAGNAGRIRGQVEMRFGLSSLFSAEEPSLESRASYAHAGGAIGEDPRDSKAECAF